MNGAAWFVKIEWSHLLQQNRHSTCWCIKLNSGLGQHGCQTRM